MSKSNKVKVMEAFRIKEKAQDSIQVLAFKVQLRKDQEPINMLYDQLKFTYPNALIEFYETKAPLFQWDQHSDDQETSLPEDQDLFDYDNYLLENGSKVLAFINSFTLSLNRFPDKKNHKNDTGSQRVFESEAVRFYNYFIKKQTISLEQKQEAKIKLITRPNINQSKKNDRKLKDSVIFLRNPRQNGLK